MTKKQEKECKKKKSATYTDKISVKYLIRMKLIVEFGKTVILQGSLELPPIVSVI